jgi:hypothetical protein
MICFSYVVTYYIKITGGDQILGKTNFLQNQKLILAFCGRKRAQNTKNCCREKKSIYFN